MGGFFRSFIRAVISKPNSPIQRAPVQTPVQAPEAPVAGEKDKSKQILAGKSYGSSSIMTSSQGIEEEANVSKTVLGGTVQKRKKI